MREPHIQTEYRNTAHTGSFSTVDRSGLDDALAGISITRDRTPGKAKYLNDLRRRTDAGAKNLTIKYRNGVPTIVQKKLACINGEILANNINSGGDPVVADEDYRQNSCFTLHPVTEEHILRHVFGLRGAFPPVAMAFSLKCGRGEYSASLAPAKPSGLTRKADLSRTPLSGSKQQLPPFEEEMKKSVLEQQD
ncbi:hypothetical protein J6590_009674 [Homalodisca vitripennis]|nr:hypothetical protein J6590_009674 [Homalodisca vitripennis]